MKKLLMFTALFALVGAGVTGCGKHDDKKGMKGGEKAVESTEEKGGVLNVLEKAKEATENAAKGAVDAAKDAGNAVADTAKDAADAAENAVEGAADAVKEGADKVVETADKAAEAVKETGESIIEKVEEGAEKVADEAKEVVEKAEEKTEEVMEDKEEAATGAMYQEFSTELYETAQKSGESYALYFAADWCPTCVALDKEIVANMLDLPAKRILKVDYDKAEELKKEFAVTKQHTAVFFDAKGNSQTVPGVTLDDMKKRLQ